MSDAGYADGATGIDPDACRVQVQFNHQSLDINQGVDRAGGVVGAGDQGLMFGYATSETPERLPLTLALAHQLVRRQAALCKSGELAWLGPDAKSQVTARYVDGKPVEITAVVLSTQHAEAISIQWVRVEVERHIVRPVLRNHPVASDLQLYINATGRFVTGGPKGNTDLTGRKIIVDTYGDAAPHGGGAFPGKDPSKVDRSAAYAARYLANLVVARGWAQRCLIQLAYAIGVAQPVSFSVETFGTETLDPIAIAEHLRAQFDLIPAGIIRELELLSPIYRTTAAYGHFGRQNQQLPWEAV